MFLFQFLIQITTEEETTEAECMERMAKNSKYRRPNAKRKQGKGSTCFNLFAILKR